MPPFSPSIQESLAKVKALLKEKDLTLPEIKYAYSMADISKKTMKTFIEGLGNVSLQVLILCISTGCVFVGSTSSTRVYNHYLDCKRPSMRPDLAREVAEKGTKDFLVMWNPTDLSKKELTQWQEEAYKPFQKAKMSYNVKKKFSTPAPISSEEPSKELSEESSK